MAEAPPPGRLPGPLAARDGKPAFTEPWQAQTMALAHALVERGTIAPGDWSAALGAALRDAVSRGAPDTAETYYAAALTALESVLGRLGLDADAVADRTEAWRRAYLATPHGRPVELPES